MKNRCPSLKFIGIAKLERYKLQFDGFSDNWGGSGASIVKSNNGHFVWGALYEFNEENEIIFLDECEGLKLKHYKRELLEITDSMNNSQLAWVYVRTKKEMLGKPSQKYLDTILAGIKDCKIPKEYVKIICQI